MVLVPHFLIYMHYFFLLNKVADRGRNAVPTAWLSEAQPRKVLCKLLNITQTMQLIPFLPHLCYSNPNCLLNRGFKLHCMLQSDCMPNRQNEIRLRTFVPGVIWYSVSGDALTFCVSQPFIVAVSLVRRWSRKDSSFFRLVRPFCQDECFSCV